VKTSVSMRGPLRNPRRCSRARRRISCPTAAAGSFLLLPAGHRLFARCRSEADPLACAQQGQQRRLTPRCANFARYLILCRHGEDGGNDHDRLKLPPVLRARKASSVSTTSWPLEPQGRHSWLLDAHPISFAQMTVQCGQDVKARSSNQRLDYGRYSHPHHWRRPRTGSDGASARLGRGIGRSAAGHWPGPGPQDQCLLEIARNLSRARDLVTHYGRDVEPTGAETRADIWRCPRPDDAHALWARTAVALREVHVDSLYIQVHRTLDTDPDAADMVRIGRVQALIASAAAVVNRSRG
jgi:hypothetical protein